MRNREVIEREMYRAREDLEQSVAELKHVVQEKIDIKARARVAVERGKAKAVEALERGKDVAKHVVALGGERVQDAALRGRDGAVDVYNKAKDRPVMTGAIIAGVIGAGVLVYVGRQKDWW